MKRLLLTILLLFIAYLSYGQTKQDSLELVKYKTMYENIYKAYTSTDSLQIKRLGMLDAAKSLYSNKLLEINKMRYFNHIKDSINAESKKK